MQGGRCFINPINLSAMNYTVSGGDTHRRRSRRKKRKKKKKRNRRRRRTGGGIKHLANFSGLGLGEGVKRRKR